MVQNIKHMKDKKIEIIQTLEEIKHRKSNFLRLVRTLNEKYHKGSISYSQYNVDLKNILNGKSIQECLDNYDLHINNYKSQLYSCREKIEEDLIKKNIFIGIISLIIIFSIGFVLFYPQITGLAFGIPKESNFIQNISEEKTAEIPEETNFSYEEKPIENNLEEEIKNKPPEILEQTSNFSTSIEPITLASANFESERPENSSLPFGIFVQASGESNSDDGCLNGLSWQLTEEGFSGKGIIYIPSKDEIGCGIKLPSFLPNKKGKINLSFNFKTNFTNTDSYMEFLNYGFDNCNVRFNGNGILFQNECSASVIDLGNGWKKLLITNWDIKRDTELIHIYISPPTILNEKGVMIIDQISLTT